MADEAAVAAEIPFPIAGTVPKDETNVSARAYVVRAVRWRNGRVWLDARG